MSSDTGITPADMETLKSNLDQFFLVVMAMIIFLMQAGFAFLEVGAVRSKNTTNILMKNVLDCAIGSVVYWICGYAFFNGKSSNAFCGASHFFLSNLPPDQYATFFFHFVFAATASTIVSGAMAERTNFIAYFIYSVVITGFVYPISAHWAWNEDGWLKANSWKPGTIQYRDFAGSGVVHMVGGAAALVGAIALGPRQGLFEKDQERIKGHSIPMVSLGAFMLFFGFFAFNGGSQAQISQPGDGAIVARALVNTILSGSVGGLTVVLIYYGFTKKFSLLGCLNGMLTGMVAICAGCDALDTWAAVLTGCVAGVIFITYSKVLYKLKIDDPVDAVGVHYGGGSWGIMAVCLLAEDEGVFYKWDGDSFLQLLWNLVGGLVITCWTVLFTAPLFFGLNYLEFLRVSPATEERGLDKTEHEEEAYPQDNSWGGDRNVQPTRSREGNEMSDYSAGNPNVANYRPNPTAHRNRSATAYEMPGNASNYQTTDDRARSGTMAYDNPL